MNQIIPAILPKSREELVEKLNKLLEAGYSGKIQIDVCDGIFVSSKTWPFTERENMQDYEFWNIIENDLELKELLSKFEIQLDLMIENPNTDLSFLNSFSPNDIVFHLDSIDNEELGVQITNSLGKINWLDPQKLIFAFSVGTDLEKFNYWYDEFRFKCRKVQIMGIKEIGNQGEPFNSDVIGYIQTLKEKYPGIEIQVDGSVNTETIGILESTGATRFICGSSVFGGDVVENIVKLQELVR
jgi:pentose-5-phosphate-3-epimerase